LVAKELQKRRDNLNKTKEGKTDQKKTFTSKKITNEVTFAQATQARATQDPVRNEQQTVLDMLNNIQKTMSKLSERLDKLEEQNLRSMPLRNRNKAK